MSIYKKATALLAAVCIAAGCASCGKNTTTALTVDGEAVPAGIYIFYANSAYSEAMSRLAEELPDLDTTDTKAAKTAVLDGVDVMTWIQDKATEYCTEYVAVDRKFRELGLTLDAETKSEADSYAELYWNYYGDTFYKNGISESSYQKIVYSSYKEDLIFQYYYGIDGELGVTEDELKDYYASHYIRSQYVQFNLFDGEGNMLKSDGKAEMMEMVESYRDDVQAAYEEGGQEAVMTALAVVQEDYNYYCTSISEEAAGITGEEAATTTPRETTAAETTAAEDEPDGTAEAAEETDAEQETTAAEETDEEETTAAAAEEDEDTTTTEAASEDTDITDEQEESAPDFSSESIIAVVDPEDYDSEDDINYTPSEKAYKKLEEIDSADYAKPFIVEEDEAYYLLVRYDITERMTEDDLWTEYNISASNNQLHGDDFDDMLSEWAAALSVERNTAAYNRYDPFKFQYE